MIIRGIIIDLNLGDFLVGVNVIVKGIFDGDVVDIDGNYNIIIF